MDCRSAKKSESIFAEPEGAQSQNLIVEETPRSVSEEASMALRETFANAPQKSPSTESLGTAPPAPNFDHIWPQSRKTQGNNFLFYSFCAVITIALYFKTSGGAIAGNLLIATFVLCSALAMASSYYFLNYRNHVSLSDELPFWSQRLLRAIALFLPLALIAGTLSAVIHNMFNPTPHPDRVVSVTPATRAITLDEEYALANKYYYENKFDDAIAHFQNVVRLDPKNEVAYQRISDSYIRVSPLQPAKSIDYADKALALNPYNLFVRCTKAYALNWLNRYDEALALSLSSAKLNPNFGEAYATSAYSYRKLGQMDKALAAANKHQRLHTWEYQSYEIRAAILDDMGRKKEAARDWSKVKEIQERDKK